MAAIHHHAIVEMRDVDITPPGSPRIVEMRDVDITSPGSLQGSPHASSRVSSSTQPPWSPPDTPGGTRALHREIDAFLDRRGGTSKRKCSCRVLCGVATAAAFAATAVAAVAVAASTRRSGGGGSSGSCGAAARAALPSRRASLTRIAFGSCADQSNPQPYWDTVARYAPDVLILAGDNVYGDCGDDPECRALTWAYGNLTKKPSYVGARSQIPTVATWDDHDYGLNDGGAANPFKHVAKEAFLDFVDAAPDDERRRRDGVYTSYAFGAGDRVVQILLLDLRWFRSDFAPSSDNETRYEPRADGDMLGAAQWAWLRDRLAEPAALRLLVSSIQVVADGHNWECWRMITSERDELYRALDARNGGRVVVLSGDRHRGGFYRRGDLVEATASSWTHTLPCDDDAMAVSCEPEPGPNRLFPMVAVNHFGTVDVDWNSRVATVSLRRAETEQGTGHLSFFDDAEPNSTWCAGCALQAVDVDL